MATKPAGKSDAKLAPGVKKASDKLRKTALKMPEAVEEFPWGHSAFKVKGKSFAFLFAEGEKLSMTAKLPTSGEDVLMLPFTEPTGYGLGKSGWGDGQVRGRGDSDGASPGLAGRKLPGCRAQEVGQVVGGKRKMSRPGVDSTGVMMSVYRLPRQSDRRIGALGMGR